MSKIDFSAPIKTLSGQSFKTKEGDADRDMTLADAAVEGLLAPTQAPESGEEKFRLFKLAERIYKAGEVDVEPEEIALIKQKIGAHYLPAVVGPAFKLLNG
jgi:hypothetical protein